LLFAEGTRSRTGAMGRMLPGAARYLEGGPVWLVPAGLTGSEALFPIHAETVHPARAELHVGEPLRADVLLEAAGGDRRLTMDAVGLAVAALLPAEYRGVYIDGFPEPQRVLAAARAASGS
jgi:1-acyl-sn-glycerol-3-phosphate acyltransferase